MKNSTFPLLAAILLCVAVMAFVGCGEIDFGGSSSGQRNRDVYGGTDPKGDLVEVTIDRGNRTVTHVNYTTGESHGPFSYAPVTDVDTSGGFSIINKAVVDSDTGMYVLFAEFEQAACVYQLFNADGTNEGNPQYVVYREAFDKTVLYGNAYTFMKFFIDEGTESNMECGFAAFDASSANGLLYGAVYGHKDSEEGEGFNGSGVADINEGDAVSVDLMTHDSTSQANIMWEGGHADDMDYAISIIGTRSGAAVLDFGPECGGGGGLVLPQTNAVDNPTTWWNTVRGTYFLLVYESDLDATERKVSVMKMVVDGAGKIEVFEMNANTSTATPVFDSTLVGVGSSDEGPNGEPVRDTFLTVAGNAAATSVVVQNAHLCKGAFIATEEDGGESSVIMMAFDPQGRFCGLTGFFDEPDSDNETIRFGFGIRDRGYSNAGL